MKIPLSLCPEQNIAFDGKYIGYVDNIESWQDCVCECQKKPGCTLTIWNRGIGRKQEKRCRMKNQEKTGGGGRRWHGGAISAEVGCNTQCDA